MMLSVIPSFVGSLRHFPGRDGSSASGSVTQTRNRKRSGGTQWVILHHWVPLEVHRRPISSTESDATSLKIIQSNTSCERNR